MTITDVEIAPTEAPPKAAFVDDDPQFLETMRLWQKNVQMAERTTFEAEECLQWVRKGEVDLVISDLRMPGIDGVRLLERAKDLNPNVQPVLLTGFEPDEKQKARLERIGAKVFSKMTDLRELLESIVTEEKEPKVARQLVELQSEVSTLKKMHEEWISDLVSQLEAIPGLDQAWISGAEEPFTVAQLIDDIKQLRPRGIEHIRLWRSALQTLRKLGKKR